MKHVKTLAAVFAGLLVAPAVALATATPANAATTCTAVFLSPHQDDEVLSMGAAIRQHVEVRGGSKVCVALFSTGQNSGARGVFTSPGFVPVGQTSPYTNATIGGSVSEFGEARDREFVASVRALGVPASNIYLDNLPGWTRVLDENKTEALQRPKADQFVQAAINHFGKVDFKTQSDSDPSVDHKVIGKALRAKASQTLSTRFYYPQYQLSRKPSTLAVYEQNAANPSVVTAAANQYGLFNPAAGRYSIGWLSVQQAFGGTALSLKRWNSTTKTWNTMPALTAPNTSLLNTRKSWVHQ